MEQFYTKADHETFTNEMFERVNRNHEEARERHARMQAKAEWKRLLRERDKGIIRTCCATIVSATACLLDSIFFEFPGWPLFLVLGSCLFFTARELVLEIKRAPAIAAARKRKEG